MVGYLVTAWLFTALAYPVVAWNQLDRSLRETERQERARRPRVRRW
jgi:hypothetical protein